MAEARQTVDLATFLARLPEAERAEVRAAAARIEALEREIGPPGWIERHLIPLGVAALGLFALGIAGLIGVLAGLRGAIGLGGVVLLVSAFPLLVGAYLWSVRDRTRLDRAKMALNEAHFLPHGGVYFGARANREGKVLLVRRSEPGEPTLRERTLAQYEKATKRRWWW
jgi:hypothetical protein